MASPGPSGRAPWGDDTLPPVPYRPTALPSFDDDDYVLTHRPPSSTLRALPSFDDDDELVSYDEPAPTNRVRLSTPLRLLAVLAVAEPFLAVWISANSDTWREHLAVFATHLAVQLGFFGILATLVTRRR